MNDEYFAATLEDIPATSDDAVLGKLTKAHRRWEDRLGENV
jgi:hypothetical protein